MDIYWTSMRYPRRNTHDLDIVDIHWKFCAVWVAEGFENCLSNMKYLSLHPLFSSGSGVKVIIPICYIRHGRRQGPTFVNLPLKLLDIKFIIFFKYIYGKASMNFTIQTKLKRL